MNNGKPFNTIISEYGVPTYSFRNVHPDCCTEERRERLISKFEDDDFYLNLRLSEDYMQHYYEKGRSIGLKYILIDNNEAFSFNVFAWKNIPNTLIPYELLFVGPDESVYIGTLHSHQDFTYRVRFSESLTKKFVDGLDYTVIHSKDITEGHIRIFYWAEQNRFEIYFGAHSNEEECFRIEKAISLCLINADFLKKNQYNAYILTNSSYIDFDTWMKTIFKKERDPLESLISAVSTAGKDW